MKQYKKKKQTKNAHQGFSGIKMPQTDFLPLFLVLWGEKKSQSTKAANTNPVSLLSRSALSWKGHFSGQSTGAVAMTASKRRLSTTQPFLQALKNCKQVWKQINTPPQHVWWLPLFCFVWDFQLHFATTNRQLSKENVCLKEATINVNSVTGMVRSDIKPLTEMKIKHCSI